MTTTKPNPAGGTRPDFYRCGQCEAAFPDYRIAARPHDGERNADSVCPHCGSDEIEPASPPAGVAATHWAQADLARMQSFIAELPAVHESNLALWQLRVDRRAETPFVPHVSLFVIEALEYATDGNRSYPTGKEFSFLVTGNDRAEASGKVRDQLSAHGFAAESFMLRSGERVLILG